MSIETRATLLEQLRTGSTPLAWEEFFRLYWPVIHAYARWRGCSENTAEDVVQDVLVKIFEQRDVFTYDPARGRFRDWLGAVVRNRVAEIRRSPSERMRAGGGDDVAAAAAIDEGPGPADRWEAAFESAVLMALLDVVRREADPREYLAFELTTLAEASPADAAAVTGLSRNVVYKARRRILKRLKDLAGDYDAEGRLPERVREAIRMRPAPRTERGLTRRVRETMRGA
ncbi:MAG: sigma-70 family RNA polymerase sigma factor [Planctomycetes bacterium]|nr:sigma-70 family RNA polymerase sigma factor [Planctomycetota bacterium]